MADEIHAVVMPKWGLAMTEGQVVSWLVAPGDAVAPGDELLEIETTKITNVLEAADAGVFRRQLVGEGETQPVSSLLGVIAGDGVSDEAIDAFIARYQERFAAQAAAENEAPPEPAIIEVAGQRLRYLEMGGGDGPPALLLHGFGADLNNWMFNQPALAENRRVIALDLPGHGGSGKDVGVGTAAGLAAQVAAFMAERGLDSAHVVGHSLGAAVAAELALAAADRVLSLSLIAPAGLGPEIDGDFIAGFIEAQRRKQLKPVLSQLVSDASLITRDMLDDVLKFKRLDGAEAALRQIAAANFPEGRQTLDLGERLAAIDRKTQVIWGRDDQIVPASQAERLPAQVALTLLEGAGHMPHMEKAGEVNGLLAAFLRDAD
ncbi:MAG TPA: acetoin dehydrogenase dihydrolipoyllysine-residue acetyltransferase subunit [Kiloniellaceae bacterium]|nr:acetoin dehydrogenase dihydrolipoyllysine-residue acetyltransferase subunit [Kiloniellaceae bacterium]